MTLPKTFVGAGIENSSGLISRENAARKIKKRVLNQKFNARVHDDRKDGVKRMTGEHMPSEMPEIRQAAHLLIGIWGEGAASYARRRRADEIDPVNRDIWERIVDEVDRYLGEMSPPTYQ